MNPYIKAVQDFHIAMGQPVAYEPTTLTEDRRELRFRLIAEETKELFEAIKSGDIPHILKELSDLLYVVYGTGVELGLTEVIHQAFMEVQRSNMSKLDDNGQPIVREDGKILKGPNYSPADMSFIKNFYEGI